MVIQMRDPLATLLALQSAVDRAWRSDWFGTRTSGRGTFPSVNVFRQDGDFIIVAELPGVKKEDLDIQIKGDEVRIVGKKSVDYAEDASLHRRERAAGRFDRTLTIPSQIDPDRAKADYTDGVLTLHLPQADSEKARSVAIN